MVRCLVLVQTSARDEKNYKVRDVKYNRNMGRLASLTTNGCVQFWDPHATFERNVRGPSPPDTLMRSLPQRHLCYSPSSRSDGVPIVTVARTASMRPS
jgi:hypothetical protein